MSGWSVGEYGEINGASSAMAYRTTIASRAMRPRRWRHSLASTLRRRRATPATKARIDDRVEHVGEQISEHPHPPADDDRSSDEIVIPRADRGHRQRAHSRPAEY